MSTAKKTALGTVLFFGMAAGGLAYAQNSDPVKKLDTKNKIELNDSTVTLNDNFKAAANDTIDGPPQAKSGIFKGNGADAEYHSYKNQMATGVITGPESMMIDMEAQAKTMYEKYTGLENPLDEFAVFVVVNNNLKDIRAQMLNLGNDLEANGRKVFTSEALNQYAPQLTERFKKEQMAAKPKAKTGGAPKPYQP